MISKRFTLPLLLLLLCSYWATAQILDDSTKVIYGPTTTRYVLESDIFNNREIAYPLDTTLNGFHNFSFPARNQNLYQDLGNLGTPMRPVFYQPPAQIGAQLGYNVFTLYGFDPEKIKYYDTKSPYTSLYYIQGGRGQQSLNFEFSANINPQWNAGFNYQRFTSQKQYGAANQNSDPLTDHHALVVFSRYKSKDSTYQVMANFTHLNHFLFDQGGVTVKATETTPLDSLVNIRIANPVLKGASTREIRNDYHLYQQYVPVAAFQLYHILDFQRRTNRFDDTDFLNGPEFATRVPYAFYPSPDTLAKSDTLSLETKYSLLENKVGIKGSFSGFNYRFHARRRDYTFTNAYDRDEIRRSENFVGAWLNYYFADSTRVFGDAEYLIGKDYRIRGEYQGKFITAGYYRTYSSPTLVQTSFYSDPYHWSNNFDNTRSDNVYGNLNVRLGGLSLQPNVLLSRIKNYVYFNEVARPAQSSASVQMLRLGLTFEFRAGHFFTSHQVYYTKTGGANLLRIPEWFSNSRIAYEVLFKKVLYIQTGVEVHYKSDYFADKYMPITQQYYLQNEFEVPGYPVADVFANFRINRVRLFFKMGHVNQGVLAKGYLTAPYYPGLRRSFGFGVNWMLFD